MLPGACQSPSEHCNRQTGTKRPVDYIATLTARSGGSGGYAGGVRRKKERC